MAENPSHHTELRTSPLDAEHRVLDAKMVEFGGWDMPIQYRSVLDEHRACRSGAAMFDVSHLGSVRVWGSGAFDALQWAFTNDLARIAPGRAQYTHLLDPVDAHVVDDIIVWWLDTEDFMVMPNASNTQPIVAALGEAVAEHGDGRAEIRDVTAERALIAVQGPEARAALARVCPDAATVARFAVAALQWEGAKLIVAGTGYTGEDGVELHLDASDAPAMWRALLREGVTPAGLGARDTLRLEAGLPLHGHELGPGITPWQADLGWVVRTAKGDFRGREALCAERERGVSRILRGIACDGRQIPRAGSTVRALGTTIGEVTSGNFSPVLERAIALAFLAPDTAIGDVVEIDIRGKSVRGVIVATPFVSK